MATSLKAHKFINPNVTGKRTAEVAVGSRLILAHNRMGATVYSIGAVIESMTALQKKRVAFLKKQDLLADQRYQYRKDVEAEQKQEGGLGGPDKADAKEASDELKKDKKGSGLDFISKLLGPFAGIAETFIRLGVILPTLKWISDPKNQESITNAIAGLQKIFQFVWDWTSGSVGMLMEGVTKMFGEKSTIWQRFEGLFKVIGGIAGLLALKALLNPIGLVTGFLDLMDWAFEGLKGNAEDAKKKVDDAKTKRQKAQDKVDKNRQTKQYKTSTKTQQIKQDIMKRYGFKSDQQYEEFRKFEQRYRNAAQKSGRKTQVKPEELRAIADAVKAKFPATLAGKFQQWATSTWDKKRAEAWADIQKRAAQARKLAEKAGKQTVARTVQASRVVGGWAADRWKQTMNAARTLGDKWKTTQAALGDLAGKTWDKVKTSAMKRIEDMGGPLAAVIKKLKGPLGKRIMKYLPFVGDIFGFIMDVIDGVHWQRALIRSIVGAGVDAGATALISALVAATPLTGGASTALAVALTAAYMGADMMVPGGFRVLLGDPVANFLKIPMFSKDVKKDAKELDPSKAEAKSESEINADAVKIARQVPQEGIRKVDKLRALEKKESGGRLTGNDAKWAEFYDYGKAAGAKYPELVSAQFALESGWGKHLAAKNNFFGIKASKGESATVSNTREVVGGKSVYINAGFKNFDSPSDAVKHLVNQWYKDYKGYRGVNRGQDALHAAALLKSEGYATDPEYARSLQRILRENKKTTEKVKGGKVDYPKGDYAAPAGSTVIAGGGGETGADAVMETPAQIMEKMSKQIAEINAGMNSSNTTEVSPAAATPSVVGGVQSNESAGLLDMAKGVALNAIDDKLNEMGVPPVIINTIPKLLPINIGANVNPVYAAVSTPMAMAKTVLGGIFG